LENRLMNRRLCVRVVSILCGFCCLASILPSRLALGQLAPATTVALPPAVIGASALTAADKLSITTFVKAQFGSLSGTDPVAQTAARKALIAALPRGAGAPYLAEFGKDWANAVTAGFALNPPVAVRLNTAIVTATLTDNGQVTDVPTESVVVLLLGDKDPCVVLWGVRAAKPMVQWMLMLGTAGQANPPIATRPLVGAIVKAVKNNGTSEIAGFIASDAYTALAVDQIPGQTAAQVQALVPPLVSPILDILEFRLSQYKSGVLPANGGKLGPVQAPSAEKVIGAFLSAQATPANTKRIVQDMLDLLSFLGQRAVLYQNNSADLQQIRDTLRYTASTLKVLVPSIATTPELSWFFPLPPACTPKDMLEHSKPIYGLIHKDPGFATITQPPDVVSIEPPPLVDPSKPIPAAGAGGAATPPAQ
jgi:hypothetical protein